MLDLVKFRGHYCQPKSERQRANLTVSPSILFLLYTNLSENRKGKLTCPRRKLIFQDIS